MKYRYQKPHELLREEIRTVLVLEPGAQDGDYELPLFTSGMPALFCKTERGPKGLENILQLTLYGKSTPSDIWSVKKKETVVAFLFKPFTLAALFNVSAAELMKENLGLDHWNAHKTNALKTQLTYAKTVSQKTDALESLLIHQFEQQRKECEIIRYATDQILSLSGKANLPKIQRELKVNERTFQRIFKKYVGTTPNQFKRICQFQLSFSQLKGGKFDKLTNVAFDNDFADQSHFIRSFKEFTEMTPKHYVKSGLKSKK